MGQKLSEGLESFVRQRFASAEQIDIILLLRSDPTRSWTAPEVAANVGTPQESTAMRLFLLASNGLIVFEASGVPRYRYAAADAETEELLRELGEARNENREAIDALFGVQADPIRSFADAFKLKK